MTNVEPAPARPAVPAELSIINATVVTADLAQTVVPSATIAISNGRITFVGSAAEAPQAGSTVDAKGAIVLPGLINTHAHLAMTLLRGVADDRDLDGFLGRVLPIEGALVDPAFVEAGTEIALGESLLGGITSTIDMYFSPDRVLAVAAALGTTVHNGPVFFEFDGPDHKEFGQRMAEAEAWLAEADVLGRPKWICPHSTYLLSEAQLITLADLATRHQARVHVHAAETQAELLQVATRHGGRTPVRVLHDTGLLGHRTVLAHAVHLSDSDIELTAAAGAHVAHNPASNFKLSSGLAPIERYLDAGINVALGTDGAASANDLDLWVAMRLASYARKASSGNPTTLGAAQVVAMATRHGALAAGTGDETGSIEVGKWADLIVMQHDSLALSPSFDPISTLAYAATRREVAHVIHHGRLVVNDSTLVNARPSEILKRAEQQISRVREML